MASFDADTLFDMRAKQALGESDGSDDYTEEQLSPIDLKLRERAERKKAQLDAKAEEAKSNLRNRNSFVSGLGLDPGGAAGVAVNSGARVLNESNRMVGNVATLGPNVAAASMEGNVPDEVLQAQARKENGEAIEGDEELLAGNGVRSRLINKERQNQQMREGLGGFRSRIEAAEQDQQARETKTLDEAIEDTNYTQQDDFESFDPETQERIETVSRDAAEDGISYGERLDAAKSLRDGSGEITEFLDTNEIIHQELRGDASEDFAVRGADGFDRLNKAKDNLWDGETTDAAMDAIAGSWHLLKEAPGIVGDNKRATLEFMVEQVPQLGLGMLSKKLLTAETLGMGLQASRRGVEKYKAENDGELPQGEDERKIYMNGLAAGLVERVIQGKLSDSVQKAVMPMRKSVGFIPRAANTTQATAMGTFGEGIVEGPQQYFEGQAALDPATGAQMYEGMVMGGASGAGMTGGGRAVSEFRNTTEEDLERLNIDRAKQRRFDNAVQSGDVSSFLNGDDPENFDPSVAVAALSQRIKMSNEPSPEDETKINEILEGMEESLEKEEAKFRHTDPQNLQQNENMERQAEQDLNQATSADEVSRLQKTKAVFGDLVQATKNQTNRKRKRTQKALNLLRAKLEFSRKSKQQAKAQSRPKGENLDTLVETAQTETRTDDDTLITSEQASQEIVKLAMEDPDLLTTDQADSIADFEANGLDNTQRAFLKEFSKARAARDELTNLEKISKDIQEGNARHKGLSQYRQDLETNISTGNKTAAAKQVGGVTKFAEKHRSKADAAQKAFEQVKDGDGKVQIARDSSGTFGVKDANAGRTYGELTISAKSGNLVNNIETEARAVEATRDEMGATYNMAFNQEQAPSPSPSPASASNDNTEVDTEASEISPDDSNDSTPSEVEGTDETSSQPSEDAQADNAVGVEDTSDNDPVQEEVTDEGPTETNEAETRTEAETTEQADPEPEVTPEPETEQDATEAETTPQTEAEEAGTEGERTESEPEPDGKLSALQSTVGKITNTLGNGVYEKANLVARYFKQVKYDSENKSNRPLVAVKDFISKADSGELNAEKYVADFEKRVSEAKKRQQKAIDDFISTAKEWNADLADDIAIINNDNARFRDYVQFLLDDDGNLDENARSAIVFAAYNWTAEIANGQPFNTDKDINAVLMRASDHEVTPQEREQFRSVGVNDKVIMASLGRQAAQALGLQANKKGPKDNQASMESALGAYALNVLIQQGIVERQIIDVVANEDGLTVINDQSSNGRPFIRMARDEQGNPTSPQAQHIGEVTKNTQNVLSKMFSVEVPISSPHLQPQDFVQTTTNKTDRKIPRELAEILQEENQKPIKVQADMYGVFTELEREDLEDIVGVERTEGRKIQKQRRASVDGRNDGLLREIDNFQQFTQRLIEEDESGDFSINAVTQPVYLSRNAWRMHRVGIANTEINTQTSKFQRHMMTMDGWEVDVRLDDDKTLKSFRLAIAEGLGIKTEKQQNVNALDELSTKLESEDIQSAVTALKKNLNGQPLTVEDRQAIVAGVKAGKEKTHSLEALLNLAKLENAQDNGLESFTTQMMREVDGLNNGPILTITQLAAGENGVDLSRILNKGGIFETGNDHSSVSTWAEQSQNTDLYQSLTQTVTQTMQNTTAQTMPQTLGAVLAITGPLEEDGFVTGVGRDLVKTPLTAMVFGSGLKTGVNDMAGNFVDSIYDRVQELADANDTEGLETLFRNVNRILNGDGDKKDDVPFLNPRMSRDQALELQMSPQQTKALEDGFTATIGEPVEKAMKTQFDPLLKKRRKLNQSAQTAYQLYEIAYQNRKQALVQELIKRREMPTNKKGEPRQDITEPQDKQIRDSIKGLEPILHTPFSRTDDDLEAGIYLSKNRLRVNQNDVAYNGEVKFKRVMDGAQTQFLKTSAVSRENVNPGVAGLIMAIHSSDSAIAARAYKELQALNVHDALGVSIKDIEKAAYLLNKNTFEVMRDYSVPQEMSEALQRTVEGFHNLMRELPNDTDLIERYKGLNDGIESEMWERDQELMHASGVDPVTYLLQTTHAQARTNDLEKLNNMLKWNVVDQYSMEGGEYTLQDADHESVRRKIEEVQQRDISETLRKARELSKTISETDTQSSTTTPESETVDDADVSGEETPSQAPQTPKRTQSATAATLNQWVNERRADLTQRRKNGETVSKKELDHYKRIKKMTEVYTRTGSLNQAVNESLPASMTIEAQNGYKREIQNRLNNNPVNAKDFFSADDTTVLNLVSQVAKDTELSTEQQEALATLQTDMATNNRGMQASMEAVLTEDQASKVQGLLARSYNSNRQTVYGEVGQPLMNSDPELVQFMQDNPNMKAGDLLDKLKEKNKNELKQPNGKFNEQLLSVLSKTVDRDMPVHYITERVAQNTHTETGVRNAKGWYEPKQDGASISIKSPEFVNSGITMELLLHELTHAGLQKTVAQEQARKAKNPDYKSDALSSIEDLELLLEKARDRVNSSEALKNTFAPAVGDLQELLAWGLTNHEFQKEVLQKVEVEGRRQVDTTSFTNGMKVFLDSATDLLFKGLGRKRKEQTRNGLSVFITNSSQLFDQAAKEFDGNTTVSKKQKMEESDPLETTKQFTVKQIYDALAEQQNNPTDPDVDTALREVMDSIVEKVQGPLGAFKNDTLHSQAYTPEDVFFKTLDSGQFEFSSAAMAAKIELTDQQRFVLEQIEASVNESLQGSYKAQQELKSLFNSAKANLKYSDFHDGDWATADLYEEQRAKEIYDFVFTPQSNEDGTSNYLSRFVALSVTYKPLHDALDKHSTGDVRSVTNTSQSLLGRLMEMLKQALDRIFNRTLDSTGKDTDSQRLRKLAESLAEIDAKHQTTLAKRKDSLDDMATATLQSLQEEAIDYVNKAATSSKIRESGSVFVRATGAMTSTIASKRVGHLLRAIQTARAESRQGRENFADQLLTEMKKSDDITLPVHRLVRHSAKTERDRREIVRSTQEQVLASMKDGGKNLSNKQRASLTRVLMRTDMAALLDTHTQQDLLELVTDSDALEQQISDLEQQLNQFPDSHANMYVKDAKDLGYFMATGKARGPMVKMNAHNIAQRVGKDTQLHRTRQDTTNDQVAQATKILDPLVSLYALRYTTSQSKSEAAEIMKTETARGRESGTEMILRFHKGLQDEARTTLFNDNPTQMRKGYTQDLNSPYRDIAVATTLAEAKNLRRQGYVQGSELGKDKADTNSEMKVLYVRQDAKNHSSVSAIFRYTDTKAKGSKTYEKGFGSKRNAQAIETNKEVEIAQRQKADPDYDPAMQSDEPRMVPIVDSSGEVTGFRYMMDEGMKDTVLDRDNNMDEILGSMTGTVYDKVRTKEVNDLGVEALKIQFDQEGTLKPDQYLEISEQSTDPKLREMWKNLPEDTKASVRKVWGENKLMVRADMIDATFGYQKWSVTELFDGNESERGYTNAAFVGAMEFVMGERAAYRLGQAEDVWQGLVDEVKDIVVVKSLVTLAFNLTSNFTQLFWMGMNKGIMSDQLDAVRNGMAYERDINELRQLENITKTDYMGNEPQDVMDRIVVLRDSLARNPIKEFVDEGMFNTIIEDVDVFQETKRHQPMFERNVDKTMGYLPKSINKAGRALYFAHDTPMYKILNKATVYSDFAARFALDKHMRNRKKNPLSKADSLELASDAFVNYDVPTSKGLQYINDNGLLFFTKYYLRIQRTLMFLYRDQPMRAMALAGFAAYFTGIPTIMGTSLADRYSLNPLENFDIGAAKYPEALGELGSLKILGAAMSPIMDSK